MKAEERFPPSPGECRAEGEGLRTGLDDCAPIWFFLDSGRCEAAYNMSLDEALLEALPRLQKPVLRFYGWSGPAATFGYFQKMSEVEQVTSLRPLIRRPTGGGLVPHDADWTYSLGFPPGHEWHLLPAEESYRRIHEWLRLAFAHLGMESDLAPCCKKNLPGQCFVGHEKSDLLWRGRKIAGAAQRRNKLGLLIQGSVQPPPSAPGRGDWEDAMRQAGSKAFGAEWRRLPSDLPLFTRAAGLACEKYSADAYNRKR